MQLILSKRSVFLRNSPAFPPLPHVGAWIVRRMRHWKDNRLRPGGGRLPYGLDCAIHRQTSLNGLVLRDRLRLRLRCITPVGYLARPAR